MKKYFFAFVLFSLMSTPVMGTELLVNCCFDKNTGVACRAPSLLQCNSVCASCMEGITPGPTACVEMCFDADYDPSWQYVLTGSSGTSPTYSLYSREHCETERVDGVCTPVITTEFGCRGLDGNGYYAISYSSAGRCVKCPSGGQVSGYGTAITNCYIPANVPQTDSTGTYEYTEDCFYESGLVIER